MASRPVWKGFLRFNLVSVPVRAYNAMVGEGGKISFNQLHKGCNARVQYKKSCPVHGELKTSDIVKGYEFADDQYVVVDESELEKLRTPRDRNIEIACFFTPGTIDPQYLTDRHLYLTPDGPPAQKPYALLMAAMEQQRVEAFAQVVMNNREQMVLVRPLGRLLAMTVLNYGWQMKPMDEFEAEVADVKVEPKELKLAKTLTEAMAVDDFDISKYPDRYQENLTKLVESKVKGEEIVQPPAEEEEPMVINLMEALEKSVAQAKQRKRGGA